MMWWRNRKISTKLLSGFGVIVFVFVISVFVMWNYITVVENYCNEIANTITLVMDSSDFLNEQIYETLVTMNEMRNKESDEAIDNFRNHLKNLHKATDRFIELNKTFPQIPAPIYAVKNAVPLVNQYTEIADRVIVAISKKQELLKELVIVGEDVSAITRETNVVIHDQLKTNIQENKTVMFYLASTAGLSTNLIDQAMSIRHDVWYALALAQAGKGVEEMKKISEKVKAMQNMATNLELYFTSFSEDSKKYEDLMSCFKKYEDLSSKFLNTCIELGQLNEEQNHIFASLENASSEIANIVAKRLIVQSKFSVEELETTVFIMLIATIFSIVLSLVIAYAISRSISKPLNRIVSLANRAGEGDLTIKKDDFNYDGNDEMGKMITALAAMVKNQNKAMTNIVEITKALTNLAGNLSAISQETNAAMEEIKASVSQVRELSESNSSALEESNAGVEEMNAGAYSVAQSATDSASSISQTTEASNKAIQTVRKVIEGMRDVAINSKESEGKIHQLVSSVENVSSFVSVITGIAAQTNLLALNAAIEAARAGEVGRGFAVVAEEVRKLAEDSAHAAKNVDKIIQELQNGAQKTIKVTIEAGNLLSTTLSQAENALSELNSALSQINKANESIHSIAAIAEEQAASSKEVAQAIDNITKSTVNLVGTVENIHRATDETAQATETVAKQAESMTSYSKNLDGLLSMFKLEPSESTNARMLEDKR
ncbi:MAG: methyl-accepting chemotaxis protein [Oscillospiraceae bacterium]|jgi:methyl-accepting chemotaxis protein|nr:methyl-accepting chemotaxis protein [Oscillospiraceae bacterium]